MSIEPFVIEQFLLDAGKELYEHREIVKTVIDAIVTRNVEPSRIRVLIEQEITRKADEQMRKEFPTTAPPVEPLPPWLPVSKP